MTLTPSEIDHLLAEHGLRVSKALGQHFLADPNTARKIVRLAGVGEGDRVVEVGPGVGSLTLALVDAGAEVVAVERDRHVLPALAAVLEGAGAASKVRVVEGDALTLDYSSVLDGGPWSMVSNLPYNIATPLVARFLEDVPQVTRMLVMVQREVGERLAAPPGVRAAGAISVKVAYHAEARIVGVVPPTVFKPRPKVESALLELVRRPAPPVEAPLERMFELVRAGFAHRRKTLRRALGGTVSDATFESAGVEPSARAEQLTLDQWAALAREAS